MDYSTHQYLQVEFQFEFLEELEKNGLSENYQPVLFSSGGFATPVKNWKVNIIGDRAQGILKTQFIVF